MPLDPDEFHAHAQRAAGADGRLPLSRMTYWDVFPFDQEGLRVAALEPPVLPEPPREGDDPSGCTACTRGSDAVWEDENWRLRRIGGVGVPLTLMLLPRDHHDLGDLPDEHARELGVLTVHVARAVEALPHTARCHVYRLGDGGAHLHVWFLARPEGLLQLRGSCLAIWDDLLPEYPADVAAADAARVAQALVVSYGGTAT